MGQWYIVDGNGDSHKAGTLRNALRAKRDFRIMGLVCKRIFYKTF